MALCLVCLLGASLSVRKSIGAALDVVERHAEAQALQQAHKEDWAVGLRMSTVGALGLIDCR